jgi:hypothetical protein
MVHFTAETLSVGSTVIVNLDPLRVFIVRFIVVVLIVCVVVVCCCGLMYVGCGRVGNYIRISCYIFFTIFILRMSTLDR